MPRLTNVKALRVSARPGDGKPTEEQFLGQVKKLAQVCGYRVGHHRWSMGTDAGIPDLFMVRPTMGNLRGRLIFAELKVRAKVTLAQQAWLDDLKAAGQEAYLFVWREGILDEIASILRR